MLPTHDSLDTDQPYLHGIDLVRIILIAGVLLNHTTTTFAQQMTATYGKAHLILLSTHLMLHFTRMGFMFITGLVLSLRYFDHHRWPSFWLHRYSRTVWPYLFWNAAYLALAILITGSHWSLHKTAHTYRLMVMHGNSYYMYYMLILFQFYLAFPLVVALFKRVKDNRTIITVSFLSQLSLEFILKYAWTDIPHSTWIWWLRAYGVNVFAYQFYFLLGVVVFLHYGTILHWLHWRRVPLVALTVLMSFGTIAYYLWNKHFLGDTHHQAVSPHQPYMLLYDTMVILCLLGLNDVYQRWWKMHRIGRLQTIIHLGGKLAFGVYLDQTLGLDLLEKGLSHLHLVDWQLFVTIPIGYLLVLTVSFGIAWLFYRIPTFGILVGRPNFPHHRQQVKIEK